VIKRATLLLASALLSACGPESVATQPATATTTEAPTPTPVTIDWTPASLPDTAGSWLANGVVADAEGFLLFGAANDRPAVWTSADAEAWKSMPLAGLGVGLGAFPAYAARSDAATVLIGVGGTNQCAHPAREYLWRRGASDETWAAVPFVEALFCAGGVATLAATPAGFAVAGTNAGGIPFAWQSTDGSTWLDAGRGLAIDSPPAVLAAIDDGFLLLGRGERTIAEASVDGRSWTIVQAPPVPPAFNTNGGLAMSPVVLIDTVLGPLAIFESDDGLHSAWRRLPDDSWAGVTLANLVPPGRVSGGVSIDDRTYLFLIAGGRGRLVVSKDLSAWTEILIPPLSSINGLAELGGRLVLVGSVIDAQAEPHWQVWVGAGPPSSP
jgi:hypothetical protein